MGKRLGIFSLALIMMALSVTSALAAVQHAQFQWNARTGWFPAGGGTGSIGVYATSDTGWELGPLPTWISIVSGSPWVGSGVVTFQVAENTGAVRTAQVSVPGYTFTISQASGLCETSLRPSGLQLAPEGDSQQNIIVTGEGCPWSSFSGASWISVHTTNGYGIDNVLYSVGQTNERRHGAIVIGSSVYTVDQDGPQGCSYVASPLNYDFPGEGGIGSFDIFLNSECPGWSVTSDSPWVTIISGGSDGSGTARYLVAANPTNAPRQAVLIYNGAPHFVNQGVSATPGVMTIKPGPTDGQDTSFGSVYFQNGTPNDGFLTYGGSGDSFSDYYRFDVSSGFPSNQVNEAYLMLYVSTRAPLDPHLVLSQITEAWTETSVRLSDNPDSQLLRYLPELHFGYNSINITDLYKRWRSGSTPNHGIKISPTSTPANARGYLTSSEHPDPAKRPYLVIFYRDENRGSSVALQQKLRVKGTSWCQHLFYNYDTGLMSTTPAAFGDRSVPMDVPIGDWVGAFHYDYDTASFTQGLFAHHENTTFP